MENMQRLYTVLCWFCIEKEMMKRFAIKLDAENWKSYISHWQTELCWIMQYNAI